MNARIAPSILSADFTRLGDEVEAVLSAGADLIHFDVMDNHYVPNLTVGPMVLRDLKKRFPDVLFDVHLMCDPVDSLVEEFLACGAGMISIHAQTSRAVGSLLESVRTHGASAGLALNPADGANTLEPFWNLLDHVLVMSVKPGFGGQTFMPEVLPKLSQLRNRISVDQHSIQLEIDGGINETTISQAHEADIFVAGSAVFNSDDYSSTISKLRSLATSGA